MEKDQIDALEEMAMLQQKMGREMADMATALIEMGVALESLSIDLRTKQGK